MKPNWNWLIARGIFGIVFGLLAFIWPATALIAVSVLFAVYVLVAGAMSVMAAFDQYRSHQKWMLLGLQGIVGIVAGIAALFYPGIALFSLIVLIALWAMVSGIVELALAFSAREFVGHPVWLGLAGLASILFGGAVLAWPLNGISFLVAFIGAYAVINGILFITWGIRHKTPSDSSPKLKSAFGT